jgi:molecular chaperone HscB
VESRSTPSPFEVLGIDARYDIDPEALEARYRELSRVLHPDKFAQRPSAERRMSLEKAITVNEAYRVLKDDLARANALLRVRGVAVQGEEEKPADPEFLMEVMELREGLAEARAERDLARVGKLADRVRATASETRARMSALFEANELAEVPALLARMRYFKRFLDEVAVIEDEALSGSV